jgi:hypothetical protein
MERDGWREVGWRDRWIEMDGEIDGERSIERVGWRDGWIEMDGESWIERDRWREVDGER